jgi:hypothetical protein
MERSESLQRKLGVWCEKIKVMNRDELSRATQVEKSPLEVDGT